MLDIRIGNNCAPLLADLLSPAQRKRSYVLTSVAAKKISKTDNVRNLKLGNLVRVYGPLENRPLKIQMKPLGAKLWAKNEFRDIQETIKVRILKLISQLTIPLACWEIVSKFQSQSWSIALRGSKKNQESSYTIEDRKLKLIALKTHEKLSVSKNSDVDSWSLR